MAGPVSIYVSVSFAWWVHPYGVALCVFAWAVGSTPDWTKYAALVSARGLIVNGKPTRSAR